MVFEREIKAVFCLEMPVFDSRDKCSSLFENEMLKKNFKQNTRYMRTNVKMKLLKFQFKMENVK